MRFLLLGVVFFILSCSKNQKQINVTLDLSHFGNSSSTLNKVGTLGSCTAADAGACYNEFIINVTGPEMQPIYKKVKCLQSSTSCVVEVSVASGEKRLFQIIMIEDQVDGSEKLHYGDSIASISGSESQVKISLETFGVSTKSYAWAGRYYRLDGSNPTGLVNIFAKPFGDRPAMLIEQTEMFDGFFKFFMIESQGSRFAGFRYILNGNERLFPGMDTDADPGVNFLKLAKNIFDSSNCTESSTSALAAGRTALSGLCGGVQIKNASPTVTDFSSVKNNKAGIVSSNYTNLYLVGSPNVLIQDSEKYNFIFGSFGPGYESAAKSSYKNDATPGLLHLSLDSSSVTNPSGDFVEKFTPNGIDYGTSSFNYILSGFASTATDTSIGYSIDTSKIGISIEAFMGFDGPFKVNGLIINCTTGNPGSCSWDYNDALANGVGGPSRLISAAEVFVVPTTADYKKYFVGDEDYVNCLGFSAGIYPEARRLNSSSLNSASGQINSGDKAFVCLKKPDGTYYRSSAHN